MGKYSDYKGGATGGQEGDDTDLIPEGSTVPRPKRFAESFFDNDEPCVILSQQDGRLGFDQDDPPLGLDATRTMLHDARNARDLP